mmetsp:Transcript_6276/g.17494  ORF Transcript_6276/g.17494 Transcript_6276/m.17494 type:complete len:216 (+) Transcript_6276:424-1071(+)
MHVSRTGHLHPAHTSGLASVFVGEQPHLYLAHQTRKLLKMRFQHCRVHLVRQLTDEKRQSCRVRPLGINDFPFSTFAITGSLPYFLRRTVTQSRFILCCQTLPLRCFPRVAGAFGTLNNRFVLPCSLQGCVGVLGSLKALFHGALHHIRSWMFCCLPFFLHLLHFGCALLCPDVLQAHKFRVICSHVAADFRTQEKRGRVHHASTRVCLDFGKGA